MYKRALLFVSGRKHLCLSNHFRRLSALGMLRSSFRMRNTGTCFVSGQQGTKWTAGPSKPVSQRVFNLIAKLHRFCERGKGKLRPERRQRVRMNMERRADMEANQFRNAKLEALASERTGAQKAHRAGTTKKHREGTQRRHAGKGSDRRGLHRGYEAASRNTGGGRSGFEKSYHRAKGPGISQGKRLVVKTGQ